MFPGFELLRVARIGESGVGGRYFGSACRPGQVGRQRPQQPTSGDFGKITRKSGNRTIQLALKYISKFLNSDGIRPRLTGAPRGCIYGLPVRAKRVSRGETLSKGCTQWEAYL